MILKQPDLQKLQHVQLDMLKYIDKILTEHDLTYYLMYGTLLGAVRHNGFIPWDDDVDICMPRDHYDHFLQHGSTWVSDEYFLQDSVSDKNYCLNFAKLRKNGTIFKTSAEAALDIHHGIYIDIFPIDTVSENTLIRKIDNLVFRLLNLIVRAKLALPLSASSTPLQKILGVIPKSIALFLSKPKWHKIWDFYLKRHNKSSSSKKYCWQIVDKVPYDSSEFDHPVQIKFEDITVPIPANADSVLKKIYGDYWQPPPKNKQCAIHPVIEFSINA